MEKLSENIEFSGEGSIDCSAIAHSVAYQLRRTHVHLFQRFLSRFSALDLRPAEFSTLSLIGENPGRKQSEIAAVVGVQRANFVALINELQRRRLTERRDVPHDRRSHALYLTQAGETLLADARRAEAAFEAECLTRLGGARARDQFLTLLGRLLA